LRAGRLTLFQQQQWYGASGNIHSFIAVSAAATDVVKAGKLLHAVCNG
jgi:hypothetical protein